MSVTTVSPRTLPRPRPSWHHTVDPLLEKISQLLTEHDNALEELRLLAAAHPRIELDEHFTLACMALL